MMPDLDRIYDKAFFEEWGRGNRAYVESAEKIARIVQEQFAPSSVIDLGPGAGVYVEAFRNLDVRVFAIDGVRPPAESSFPMDLAIRDLTVPFENEWGAFDLAICFEVGEHIPEKFVGPFLENITRFSDTLLLACAPPNQEGTHHVNLQPKRYWRERMTPLGFDYDRKATGRLQEAFKTEHPRIERAWMYQQISVYASRRPRRTPSSSSAE